MSFIDVPGLRNLLGDQINPSTEETSQAILDAIASNSIGSTRDAANETTTSPGASASYVGTFTDISKYGSALPLIVSDVALATAEIEWSDDGINVKSSAIVGNTEMVLAELNGLFIYFTFIEQNRNGHYYRINTTTDVVAPTLFETISYLKKDAFLGSFSDADAEPSPQNRYLLTRTIGMARQPDGDIVNQRADGNIVLNTTPLAVGESFTSDWVDTDNWRSIEIVIKTDVVSTPGGVCLQFTRDTQEAIPSVDIEEEYEFGLQDIAVGSLVIRIPTALDGFRIVYTNNSTAQTAFFLSVDLKQAPVEIPRVRDGGILTSAPWRLIFKDTFELSGALVSGATPTYDQIGPIVASNVIDTGWFNVRRYKEQLINAVFDVQGVRIFLMNASDDHGNNTPTVSFAPGTENISTPGGGFPALQGAGFYGDYFRIVIINDSGTDSNQFSVRSMGGDTPVGAVFQSLDQPIFDFYPAPIGQSIIKGKAPSGAYESVATDGNGRLTLTSGSNFARLLARQVEDNQRLRVDAEPGTGYIYLGSAPRGTAGSAAEWEVVKILLSATFNPQDIQYVLGIAWDDRTNATHWDTTA